MLAVPRRLRGHPDVGSGPSTPIRVIPRPRITQNEIAARRTFGLQLRLRCPAAPNGLASEDRHPRLASAVSGSRRLQRAPPALRSRKSREARGAATQVCAIRVVRMTHVGAGVIRRPGDQPVVAAEAEGRRVEARLRGARWGASRLIPPAPDGRALLRKGETLFVSCLES